MSSVNNASIRSLYIRLWCRKQLIVLTYKNIYKTLINKHDKLIVNKTLQIHTKKIKQKKNLIKYKMMFVLWLIKFDGNKNKLSGNDNPKRGKGNCKPNKDCVIAGKQLLI